MGVVESVTLPKLTRKLENYAAAGCGRPRLTSVSTMMRWRWNGPSAASLMMRWAQYGAPGADAVPLRFAGSYQRDDTGETVAVEVVPCVVKEVDNGESKQGEDTSEQIIAGLHVLQLTMTVKSWSKSTSST
jgi:P2 family phage contractile tail tube protein